MPSAIDSYQNEHITSRHGNLLIIERIGVLITGEPLIGKSELTLALIDRGHQFVCDDVVNIKRENDKLIGSSINASKGCLLLRGVGLINVSKLFGPHTFVNKYQIHLSINLTKQQDKLSEDPRHPIYQNEIILNTHLPQIIFPIYAERHLPLLIETIVKNHRLKIKSYNRSDH